MKLVKNIYIYGWVYILTYLPVKLYFSQYGKTIGNKTYHKVSLSKLENSYFYGFAKKNPYF
jgi:hypothetical protein